MPSEMGSKPHLRRRVHRTDDSFFLRCVLCHEGAQAVSSSICPVPGIRAHSPAFHGFRCRLFDSSGDLPGTRRPLRGHALGLPTFFADGLAILILVAYFERNLRGVQQPKQERKPAVPFQGLPDVNWVMEQPNRPDGRRP